VCLVPFRQLEANFLIVMSACIISFIDLLMFPFDVFWAMYGVNSCNVFLMLFMVTLGSYLIDALQEGGAYVVACLPVPRA
jgi:hypothetical protein